MQQAPFGRRSTAQVPRPALPRSSAVSAPPGLTREPVELSPEAEAFRREIAAGRLKDGDAFANWRKAQRGRRLLAWVLSLLLMAPGVICFIMDAPVGVSAVVEVGGMALGWWLRRERKRFLQQISTWQDPADSHN